MSNRQYDPLAMSSAASAAVPMRTGVPGLDDLLGGGGLLTGRTVLIKGAPGTGKTTLGLQMLVEGARQFGEPGVLLTFEQIPQQLFSDMRGFGWDLERLTADNSLQVIFIKPEEVLEQPGRQENRLLVNIADFAEEYGARRVLIDSLSHLRPLFSGDQARSMMMRFLVQLKALGLTPIMTSELATNDGTGAMDAYLADTVIQVHRGGGGAGRPERRELEIVKTRGQSHSGGLHPFEIGPRGITVFPHEDPPAAPAALELAAPLGSGVPGLDPLLGGGYAPGSAILVAGLSGTFKTTLAGHFVMDGGLWITFQETAVELQRSLAGRGIALAEAVASGRVRVLECTPGRETVEQVMHRAETLVEREGLRRVVIDGVMDLSAGLEDAAARAEAVGWCLRRLHALGVTTLMTQHLARVTGRNPLSEIAWAELADTIIYLGLVEIESRLEKVISVLKHRGGPTEGDLRAIHCGAEGLRAGERFVGLSGVLAGTPLGRPKTRIEEIFQPLYFIRDFLALARDPAMDAEKRAQVLENVSGETSRLIELISRYFDQPLPGNGPVRGGKGGAS